MPQLFKVKTEEAHKYGGELVFVVVSVSPA